MQFKCSGKDECTRWFLWMVRIAEGEHPQDIKVCVLPIAAVHRDIVMHCCRNPTISHHKESSVLMLEDHKHCFTL